jgi:hypothetical protein
MDKEDLNSWIILHEECFKRFDGLGNNAWSNDWFYEGLNDHDYFFDDDESGIGDTSYLIDDELDRDEPIKWLYDLDCWLYEWIKDVNEDLIVENVHSIDNIME